MPYKIRVTGDLESSVKMLVTNNLMTLQSIEDTPCDNGIYDMSVGSWYKSIKAISSVYDDTSKKRNEQWKCNRHNYISKIKY